jgi:hypothetical protein
VVQSLNPTRVRISGAVGNNAECINGKFVEAGEHVNGAPAYQHQTGSTSWLCRDRNGTWSVHVVDAVQDEVITGRQACTTVVSETLDMGRWCPVDGVER